MDTGAQMWMFKTARRNYWRVAAWYDLDDLIQEGYLQYWRIRRRYPDVREPKHIMRLFQISFINRIHDIAKARTACLETLADDLGIPDVWSVIGGVEEPMVETLHGAPDHVLVVIRAYELGDPRLRQVYRRRSGRQRETLNERLCRIAGVNPDDYSIPTEIRRLLASV